jgi:amidase
MTTSAGAVVFVKAKASKNAAIAQKLIDAGMIILAKGNMTVRLHGRGLLK